MSEAFVIGSVECSDIPNVLDNGIPKVLDIAVSNASIKSELPGSYCIEGGRGKPELSKAASLIACGFG